jgi:hypothetical protein
MTSPISTPPAPDRILKQDQRGRLRTPVEQREALVDEFERSSLSGVKFAAMVGVKYATFANWVQKRKKARQAGSVGTSSGGVTTSPVRTAPVRLFEAFAEVAGNGRSGGLLVELPGGGRMHLESPVQVQLAAELLRLLSSGGVRTC